METQKYCCLPQRLKSTLFYKKSFPMQPTTVLYKYIQVYCNYVGYSGRNAEEEVCILTQNIISEKVYFVFWWWYAFLFVISGLQIIYRMIILAIPFYRLNLINDQTGTNDFNKIFRKSNMGDWFMLHQIGKNVDGHYFKLFINELVKTFPNDTVDL